MVVIGRCRGRGRRACQRALVVVLCRRYLVMLVMRRGVQMLRVRIRRRTCWLAMTRRRVGCMLLVVVVRAGVMRVLRVVRGVMVVARRRQVMTCGRRCRVPRRGRLSRRVIDGSGCVDGRVCRSRRSGRYGCGRVVHGDWVLVAIATTVLPLLMLMWLLLMRLGVMRLETERGRLVPVYICILLLLLIIDWLLLANIVRKDRLVLLVLVVRGGGSRQPARCNCGRLLLVIAVTAYRFRYDQIYAAAGAGLRVIVVLEATVVLAVDIFC